MMYNVYNVCDVLCTIKCNMYNSIELTWIISPRFMSENSLIGSGTSLPVASTGMSSYLSKLIPVFPVPNRSLGESDDVILTVMTS